MDNRPIGFFDSGAGGLSALRDAVRLLPDERYLYYADGQNAPFGSRSEEEVLKIAERGIAYLYGRGVKAVVIACNTATGIGAGALRREYGLDILGMEPAVRPAARVWHGGIVLVLATPATIRSKSFHALAAKYASGIPVLTKSMTTLASDIEGHFFDEDFLALRLRQELDEFRRLPVESVVLGCTHYVFVGGLLKKLFPGAAFFDGGAGTAANLKRHLEREDALGSGFGLEIVSTEPGQTALYRKIAGSFLGGAQRDAAGMSDRIDGCAYVRLCQTE